MDERQYRDEREHREWQQLCRKVLVQNPDGRRFLRGLLERCHFYNPLVKDSEEVTLNNLAKEVLGWCDIWDDLYLDDIVDALCKIRPKLRPEELAKPRGRKA